MKPNKKTGQRQSTNRERTMVARNHHRPRNRRQNERSSYCCRGDGLGRDGGGGGGAYLQTQAPRDGLGLGFALLHLDQAARRVLYVGRLVWYNSMRSTGGTEREDVPREGLVGLSKATKTDGGSRIAAMHAQGSKTPSIQKTHRKCLLHRWEKTPTVWMAPPTYEQTMDGTPQHIFPST